MGKRFLLDVFPRPTLCETYYVDELHRSVRLLVARGEDGPLVQEFVNTFGSKEEENVEESISAGYTILMVDCFEVCGVAVGKVTDGRDCLIER
jgi:hypothetical protein